MTMKLSVLYQCAAGPRAEDTLLKELVTRPEGSPAANLVPNNHADLTIYLR
jgi:hypothetical protein